MYKITELNKKGQTIGLINFNKLHHNTALETYWNLQLEETINSTNNCYIETKKIYHNLTDNFPSRIFEIRSLFIR